MTVPKQKKPGPKSKMPPVAELCEMYETHTAKEIADKCGVSVSTVRSWIRTLRASVPHEQEGRPV